MSGSVFKWRFIILSMYPKVLSSLTGINCISFKLVNIHESLNYSTACCNRKELKLMNQLKAFQLGGFKLSQCVCSDWLVRRWRANAKSYRTFREVTSILTLPNFLGLLSYFLWLQLHVKIAQLVERLLRYLRLVLNIKVLSWHWLLFSLPTNQSQHFG